MTGSRLTNCMVLLMCSAVIISTKINDVTGQPNMLPFGFGGFANTIQRQIFPFRFGDVKNTVQHQAENAVTLMKQFEEFMFEYGKSYKTLGEKMMRFNIFKDNLKAIQELMSNPNRGTAVYGVTLFADLTQEEFAAKMTLKTKKPESPNSAMETLSRRSRLLTSVNKPPVLTNSAADKTPLTADSKTSKGSKNKPVEKKGRKRIPGTVFSWSTEPFFPPVGDQGACGSCYSFATVHAVNILVSKRDKKVTQFSEQQAVDCTVVKPYENSGCDGGMLTPVFDYYKAVGLLPLSALPYVGRKQICNLDKAKMATAFKIKGYTELKGDAEIIQALPSSPIPAAMNAEIRELQLYKKGVIVPKKCNPALLNHAVLIVGYGTAKAGKGSTRQPVNFWIVQNSWGDDYGYDGLFLIKREGTCGIGDVKNGMAYSVQI